MLIHNPAFFLGQITGHDNMKAAVIKLLHAYQRFLSPALPAACRYVPTCSEYAAQAVESLGVLAGGLLAIGRLLRCHPLGRGGFDPAPVIGNQSQASKTQERQPGPAVPAGNL